MKKIISVLAIALSFSLVMQQPLQAQQTAPIKNVKANSKTTGAQKKKGVMVGGAMMLPSRTLVENASHSEQHTTFLTTLQMAGLGQMLQEKNTYTVFAPTNAAFNKVPEGTINNLMKPENKDQLKSVLNYHIVPGKVTASKLKNGQKLKTVDGKTLTVSRKGNKVTVNGAAVSTADVVSSNGVMHVLDDVLMPAVR